MRGCWAIVALAGFVMQQFVCCAATCAEPPLLSIEQPAPVSTCCGHHHHGPEQPQEPEPAHHLCVATHLFFIERVTPTEFAGDHASGWSDAAVPPLPHFTGIDQYRMVERVSRDTAEWSPSARTRRALAGVWLL